MRKLFFAFFVTIFCLGMNNSYADAFDTCMNRVLAAGNLQTELSNMIGAQNTDTEEEFARKVTAKKNNIKEAMVGIMFHNQQGLCNDLLLDIAAIQGKRSFTFRRNDKRITIRFDVQDLMNFYIVSTGIVVSKNKFGLFDKISRNYITKKTWTDSCSDYLSKNPFDSVYDNDPVNVVGQKLSGNSKDEFFLDEPENMHAFPGLLLVDVTYQDAAELLIFSSLPYGLEQTEKFARELRNTKCSGQGLYAYYVSYVPAATDNNTNATKISGIAAGGIAATTSVIGGIWAATHAGGFIAGMFGAATGAAAIPGAGWIVGGVLAAAAGIVALVSSMNTETIADLPEVTVIGGPFPI